MNRSLCLSLTTVCVIGFTTFAFGQDAEEKESTKTHTVKSGPFKIEVTLDGVFEAATTHEVILRPEAWSLLKVREVVAEGSKVKEGDPILKLETDKIDVEIREQEFALKLSELSLQQAKVALDSLERSVPLDLEAARRSQRVAEEELEYFLEVTEPQRKVSAKEALKSSEYSLEYAQEELDQLEQMYKEDDLTEETEEIILKRAKRSVNRSEYFLELAKTRHSKSLDYDIPRERQRVEESAAREKIALRKAEATLPRSLDKQRIELAKVEHAHEKLEEKLDQLKADRDLLTVTAPADGVVYYGQSDRGKWTTATTVRKQLRPGGSVTANSVIMTIVGDGPGFVRIDVPEKDYRHVKPGTKATVKPTAFPDTEVPGECTSVGPVPFKAGTFDGRVSFKNGEDGPTPIVGMTCKVTVTPYEKKEAITVPEKAVFGSDDDKHVYVQEGGERKTATVTKKVSVTIGKTSGGKTEITRGLSEDDVILLEKP